MPDNPVPDRHLTPDRLGPPSFGEAFQFWLKLGFISFGGPTGQIAIMQTELVEKKKWINQWRFPHTLNYCMLFPGREAIPFDMLDAEFSYHGNCCIFETLTKCFAISDKAIAKMGEMIHESPIKIILVEGFQCFDGPTLFWAAYEQSHAF